MYNNIIIVPYRNREKQLNYFIEKVVPLVKEFLPNTKIIIVEQEQGKDFNRGVLINIGFKLYENKTKYFIQNDIDLTPKKKCLEEYYGKNIEQNEVLAILTSPYNTYGGIVKICNDAIHKINGYPNDIWGWGAEDKALQNRGEFYNLKKITIFIHDKTKIRDDEYFKSLEDINDRVLTYHEKNVKINYVDFFKLNNHEKKQTIINNGLNTLNYNIIEHKELNSITELIKVDF